MTISADPVFGSPRDRARFRRMPGFDAVDLMDASFRDHHFLPHTHDELMLGVMRAGVKRFVREGRAHTVGPGGISVVDPGDVHTGGRFEGDRLVYTALYLPGPFLEQAGLAPGICFPAAVVDDPACWKKLVRGTAPGTDPLEAQEDLLEGLSLLARHADRRPLRDERSCSAAAARAVEHVHAHFDRPVTVSDLAHVAGVTPRHVIRSFRKATGLPPHAYLRQIRVETARRLLRGHTPLAEIALAAGFADQPQFTRTFRLVTGTTPGRYRADLAA